MSNKRTQFQNPTGSFSNIYSKDSINYFVKTKLSEESWAEFLVQMIDSIYMVDNKRGRIRFNGSIEFDLDGWREGISEKYFER